MFSPFLLKSSICAASVILFTSCRQPIDLDTDRTVVPTNVPEIIDFSPKLYYGGGGNPIITITGKNFVNVQSVILRNSMLEALGLDSVVVESTSRISARIPRNIFVQFLTRNSYLGILTLNVTTKLGSAQASENFLCATVDGYGIGTITLNKQPLDSTVLDIRYVAQEPGKDVTNFELTTDNTYFPVGWYYVRYPRYVPSTITATEVFVRPFKSGYRFTPRERQFTPTTTLFAGNNFEATPIPVEQLPSVISITPSAAQSFSGSAETGTSIVLRGTRLREVKKIMIGAPFSSPNIGGIAMGYIEATVKTTDSDNQITLTLPRLDRTKALSGKTYSNCQVYLLLENGSYLAPQRISITYI